MDRDTVIKAAVDRGWALSRQKSGYKRKPHHCFVLRTSQKLVGDTALYIDSCQHLEGYIPVNHSRKHCFVLPLH